MRRVWDVIEPTAETHLLGNYTATIDGDVAEASVRVRVHHLWAGAPGRLQQKILGSFRVKLIRTDKGWRFRHFGMGRSGMVQWRNSESDSPGTDRSRNEHSGLE